MVEGRAPHGPRPGGTCRPVEELAVAVSYTHFIYFSRTLTDEENTLDEQESPTTVPDFSGEYTRAIGVINANVELSF